MSGEFLRFRLLFFKRLKALRSILESLGSQADVLALSFFFTLANYLSMVKYPALLFVMKLGQLNWS